MILRRYMVPDVLEKVPSALKVAMLKGPWRVVQSETWYGDLLKQAMAMALFLCWYCVHLSRRPACHPVITDVAAGRDTGLLPSSVRQVVG